MSESVISNNTCNINQSLLYHCALSPILSPLACNKRIILFHVTHLFFGFWKSHNNTSASNMVQNNCICRLFVWCIKFYSKLWWCEFKDSFISCQMSYTIRPELLVITIKQSSASRGVFTLSLEWLHEEDLTNSIYLLEWDLCCKNHSFDSVLVVLYTLYFPVL